MSEMAGGGDALHLNAAALAARAVSKVRAADRSMDMADGSGRAELLLRGAQVLVALAQLGLAVSQCAMGADDRHVWQQALNSEEPVQNPEPGQ